MSGVEAIRRIRAEHAQARFIVLTTYDGDEDIHRALEAGARAYVLKDTFCDEIVETVRAVRAGLRRIPDAVAERLAERPHASDLTPRELEVLRLLAHGQSNKEIADHLGIVEGTVKIHVARILDKLGVDDRTAAAMTALQRGIIRF
jgi:two-component system NarL family response regulator